MFFSIQACTPISRSLLAILLALFSACSSAEDVHETRFIMGTLVEFSIASTDSGPNQPQAIKAIAAAAAEMQRIEDIFSIYGNAPNAVKAFNASAPGTIMALPDEVTALLELALQVQQQSNAAFDPALAKLNILWGFSAADPPSSPPSPRAIAQAKASPHCIKRHPQGWSRAEAHCQLDFGAIAKGYAIDQGIALLQQHGIHNAIINAGGDIRLIGSHGKRPWRIGIRHPRKHGEVIEALHLQGDVSIVTSGDYERFYMHDGVRYHHILNPRTGRPATASRSATVIAANATLADAWSTALFVQGVDGLELQKQMQHRSLLIDKDGNSHGSLKNEEVKK